VPPEVADPDLDGWLADFDRRHPQRHPLHGDHYAGNALAQGERLVAVLDYDEAYLGPPQREAAHAAWEWGDGLAAGKLDGAHEFLGAYAAESGPGADLDDTSLRQLIRERLRSEVRWARTVTERGSRATPTTGPTPRPRSSPSGRSVRARPRRPVAAAHVARCRMAGRRAEARRRPLRPTPPAPPDAARRRPLRPTPAPPGWYGTDVTAPTAQVMMPPLRG
jgi:hypothetical protein